MHSLGHADTCLLTFKVLIKVEVQRLSPHHPSHSQQILTSTSSRWSSYKKKNKKTRKRNRAVTSFPRRPGSVGMLVALVCPQCWPVWPTLSLLLPHAHPHRQAGASKAQNPVPSTGGAGRSGCGPQDPGTLPDLHRETSTAPGWALRRTRPGLQDGLRRGLPHASGVPRTALSASPQSDVS